MPKKLTTEDFIKLSMAVHSDRYDYSKVKYSGVNDKVEIVCNIHGSFLQSYRLHVERKNGCPHCGKAKTKRQLISKEEFLARANKFHGEKYDYSNSNYVGYKSPITIRCHKHGEFTLSRACLHVTNKNGCPRCAHRNDTQEFINKSKQLYGDFYSYEQSKYETVDAAVTIICPTHGEQNISPSDHYRIGCWFCKRNKSQDIWLTEIGIPNTKETRQVRIKIQNKLFVVDGMYNNIVYLFHGDYWHGNPRLYKATDINTRKGKTFGELYKLTIEYEETLRNNGFTIVSIWEYDWLQQKRR